MTLAANAPLIDYLENGVLLNYPAPFRFLAPTDLAVSRIVAGVETPLAYGAQWTATGGATDSGGVVTLGASVNGATLRIRRSTARSQQTSYDVSARFPAKTHERALDRLAMVDQEQDAVLGQIVARALLVPVGEAAPPVASLVGAEGKYLRIVGGKLVPDPGTGGSAADQAAAALAAAEDALAAAEAAVATATAALNRANHTGTQSADTLTDGTTNKAFLATERTKLAGVATGATANSSDAALRDRSSHTGTQSADTLTDGTTNKAFLATERTKLAGVATAATANSSDAALRDRSSHTGNGDFASGNYLRFGHANQFNSDDGKIGAALFGTGLNIVGTQTVAAGTRIVRLVANVNINGNVCSPDPTFDNNCASGFPGARWSTVYAGTGTINTSDAREKTWRGAMSAPERAAAIALKAELGFYQWNEAISEKGADQARWHFGLRAQRAWEIMTGHGLEPERYAFLCHDAWEALPEITVETEGETTVIQAARPAGDRYGLRTDQLALFILAAL